MKRRGQRVSKDRPTVHVFGVVHSDETLLERIAEDSPERVTIVYHEGCRHDGLSIRNRLIFRPLGILPPAIRGDIPSKSPDSQCERAAINLCEERGGDFHYIGMPMNERASALHYFPTLADWSYIVLALIGASYVATVSSMVGGGAFLILAAVCALPIGDLLNEYEYPIRERYMAEKILENPPAECGVGVAVVGEDHREAVEANLEAFETNSKDLTN